MGLATIMQNELKTKVTSMAIAKKLWNPFAVKFFAKQLKKVISACIGNCVSPVSKNLSNLFSGIYVEDCTSIPVASWAKKEQKAKANKQAEAMQGAAGDETSPPKGKAGSNKATVKLYAMIDIMKHSVHELRLAMGNTAELTLAAGVWAAIPLGALVIGDLGFWDFDRLNLIVQSGAYYISRVKFGTVIHLLDGTKIENMITWLKEELKNEHEFIDKEVFVGANCQLKTRMIVEKVPKAVSRKRARQLKKDQKQDASGPRLAWMEYTVIITSIPVFMCSAATIIKLYRLRWQVELFFKHLKSDLNLKSVSGSDESRIFCQLYGALILIVILSVFWIGAHAHTDRELCIAKVSKYLKAKSRLHHALLHGTLKSLMYDLAVQVSSDTYTLFHKEECKRGTSLSMFKNTLERELISESEIVTEGAAATEGGTAA